MIEGELLGHLHNALEGGPELELPGFGPFLITGPFTAAEPHLTIGSRDKVDGDDVVLRDPVAAVGLVRADNGVQHWLPRLRDYAMLPAGRHAIAVHAAARTALHLRRTPVGTIEGRVLRCGTMDLDPLCHTGSG